MNGVALKVNPVDEVGPVVKGVEGVGVSMFRDPKGFVVAKEMGVSEFADLLLNTKVSKRKER